MGCNGGGGRKGIVPIGLRARRSSGRLSECSFFTVLNKLDPLLDPVNMSFPRKGGNPAKCDNNSGDSEEEIGNMRLP